MALLGEAHAARAAIEETFVRVLEERSGGEAPAPSRGHIFRLVRAACARRENGTTQPVHVVASDSADTQRDPSATRARRALAELKPTEREAVVLFQVAKLSLSEIAEACNVDETTARTRVGRGLSRLRASLGGEP
jgi:RNA polymerase sigma-70 factor (ECF subfamily)